MNFKNRAISWSCLSLWKFDKEKWADKYLRGIEEPSTPAMEFGNVVGKRLANDPDFLSSIPRYSVFEQKITVKTGDMKLISFLDSFDPVTKSFIEYKTSSSSSRWTQKSAEDHGQMLFYYFMIWLKYGKAPEEIDSKLVYIPVAEQGDFSLAVSGEPMIFSVRHTSMDVLKFATGLKEEYKEMLKLADNFA